MGIEEENEVLQRTIEGLQGAIASRDSIIEAQREQLTRHNIVVQSKLTRRQQKMWPTWVSGVDLGKELKLKSHFTFPKIGLQAMDKGKWVKLTGTAQPEGLTAAEGADICEYLNSFPENQHQLKNMDSEFRDPEQEEKMREELEK